MHIIHGAWRNLPGKRSVLFARAVYGSTKVRLQYFIRVSIQPPTSTAAHLPSYEYERIVEVTTDACDSLEREAASLSGVSSPALSSLAAARNNGQLQSANSTYMAIR